MRAALIVCMLGCIAASVSAAPATRAAALYEMPTPKPWPLSTDPTTEEVVPGLEPTDGFAVNASTPNLEGLAPTLDRLRPLGPYVERIYQALNVSELQYYHPTLPGHYKNITSMTVLLPSKEALKKLPGQLATHRSLKGGDAIPLLPPPVKVALDAGKLSKMAHQVYRNMILDRMVPYKYLTNATRVTTKLGHPVQVIVSPDGSSKYLRSGNYTAKIVRPDYGRAMVQFVTLIVDSFLLPPTFDF